MVAAVSRDGGFGVLGATIHTPDTIHEELSWIDDHVDGKPYGIDMLVPGNLATRGKGSITAQALEARIPEAHRAFAATLMAEAGVAPRERQTTVDRPQPFDPATALRCSRPPSNTRSS